MVRKLEPTHIIYEAERSHERMKQQRVVLSTPEQRKAFYDQLLLDVVKEQNEIAKNTRRVKHAKAFSIWEKVISWLRKKN